MGITWVLRHLAVSRTRGRLRFLRPEDCIDDHEDAPRLSVIVAAKDEEKSIARCCETLLRQDYPDYELVFVNDRSADRTGDILESYRRDHPDKMKVLTIEHLPERWYGKTHAVHCGVLQSDGEYLLFSDADCDFISPRALTAAVQYARQRDIELLSVLPVVRTSCLAERIIQPVCALILLIWHYPERVNNPRRPDSYANGAFMLMRRDAYERIGGHERIRDVLLEDMQMARNAKAAGLRLHVVNNGGLYVTRMYASLNETWRGWTRIYCGSFQTRKRLSAAAVMLFILSVAPWVTALPAAVGAIATRSLDWPWGFLLVGWGGAALAQQTVMWRLYKFMGASGWRSWTYPLGASAALGIVIHALLRVMGLARATTWGGMRHSTPTAAGLPPPHATPVEARAHVG